MNAEPPSKAGFIAAILTVSIAVVGYFVGMQAPMPDRGTGTSELAQQSSSAQNFFGQTNAMDQANPAGGLNPAVILATSYKDMREATRSRMATRRSSLSDLKSNVEPLKEFTITASEKSFALQLREQNRAFNGAPPTIPHPIDQMTSESCLACHGEGISTETLRVSKMSHQFLANCTQCHVENNPEHLPPFEFRESTFVGLPAPTGGPRAFEGAPPQIPHSTWMRVNCMSCHGFSGVQGIRTTHPWRQNCEQCHAPSSELDQVQLDPEPAFLPPPPTNY